MKLEKQKIFAVKNVCISQQEGTAAHLIQNSPTIYVDFHTK
jgi:hypothetical protein